MNDATKIVVGTVVIAVVLSLAVVANLALV